MHSLLQPESSNRKKGFTLIEIVLAIGFMGVLILVFFSIIRFTDLTSKRIQGADDSLLNGRYAVEYIIEDVELSDEIVSMMDYCPENIDMDHTLGFVLINETIDEYDDIIYQHIYYRITHGSLYRTTFDSMMKCPDVALSNGGSNRFLDNVTDVGNSGYDSGDKLLFIEVITTDPLSSREYIFMESKYLGNF
ncbi:MAG: type II secretion system protein [Bacillota bacterium]